jgi:multiple sugar transport system substrate-binding protein
MTRLRLATRSQATFEDAFARQIESFQIQHLEVTIEVVAQPIHDHYDQWVERGEQVDLLLLCTDWLPEAIDKGLILAIDDQLSANPPPDWPHGWHPAMLKLQQHEGKVYGLPWHDGPEVFHYRRDLFEDPAESHAFEGKYGRPLAPPKTWDELLEVAKFFTRPETGLWGCCEAAYTDGHNNVYDFLIQLWSRGGVLLNDRLEPEFHGDIGVEALQFYVDLFHRHKVAPMECLKMGSVECGDYYAAGNAAMSWNWSGFAAVCEQPGSRIIGKNACTSLPAGPSGLSVSLNIYWVLTIPRGTQDVDLAYAFLRHIAKPESDKITSMCGANGVRLSTWRDPEVRARFPYYSIIEDVHRGTLTLPGIPQYPQVNEAISRAVHRCVHELVPVRESLEQAAAEASKILRV